TTIALPPRIATRGAPSPASGVGVSQAPLAGRNDAETLSPWTAFQASTTSPLASIAASAFSIWPVVFNDSGAPQVPPGARQAVWSVSSLFSNQTATAAPDGATARSSISALSPSWNAVCQPPPQRSSTTAFVPRSASQ